MLYSLLAFPPDISVKLPAFSIDSYVLRRLVLEIDALFAS